MTKLVTLALLKPQVFTVGSVLLAQATLSAQMGKVAGILNLISVVLFFGGLLIGCLMYMLGRTEQMKFALVGAGVGALSFVIVKTFFETSGQTIDIELQDVQ